MLNKLRSPEALENRIEYAMHFHAPTSLEHLLANIEGHGLWFSSVLGTVVKWRGPCSYPICEGIPESHEWIE
eukprot:scaffold104578_cov67-Attheya_sp.AAC.1